MFWVKCLWWHLICLFYYVLLAHWSQFLLKQLTSLTSVAHITHLCGSNQMKKLERKKTAQLIKEKASKQMFLLQNLWSETYSREKEPEKSCWETHVTSHSKHTPSAQTHTDSKSRAAESTSTRGLPEDTPDRQQHRAEHPVSTRRTRERHLRLSLPHVPV